jgi:hypothetical protein
MNSVMHALEHFSYCFSGAKLWAQDIRHFPIIHLIWPHTLWYRNLKIFPLFTNHRQYFTFSSISKKRGRIVISKSNEHQKNPLNREENFFPSKRFMSGIKKSVFLRRRFQKCYLTLVTKCTYKQLFQNYRIFKGHWHFSAQKIDYFGLNRFRCIFSLWQVYIFGIYVNLRIF